MAEIAVNFLLNQLTFMLGEELKFLGGSWEEVECIRDELERTKAFLQVADAMEESDPELQVWVKQVRDVAYDTEDVLDEFRLWFSSHHHGDSFCSTFHKICCYVKNLRARRRILTEIRRIKSRVNNISGGQQRYCYKYSISKQGLSSTVVNDTWYDHRGDALLVEEAELVGIDKPKQELIEQLVQDSPGLKVVAVVGMGGLGKTTLVKKVYDDIEVRKHFQSHAWITFSQSFKMEELLRDLIQQLFDEIRQPVPGSVGTMNNDKLKAAIKDFLQQSRYVIVLDDIWRIDAWHAIKYIFPSRNDGSRVMLTTRNVDVASTTCVKPHNFIYSVKPLSPEESWTLFCGRTFQENHCPSHLEELSKCILKKCEGLPLAIVAISGVLALKNKSRIDEWAMVYRCLGGELETNNILLSTKKILLLSYNDLPYYLKSCFLYLSIFPEDHKIECMRLIRLWTAEGFVEATEGNTPEEVAERYLNELLNRSLIQVAVTSIDGGVRLCRIHDLLREIILPKSRNQNFLAIASARNPRWPEKARRLSLHNVLANAQNCSYNFHRLRSLLMFGVADPISKSSMPILFNGGLSLLKVLDLRGASLETFPGEVVKLLHLRYLSLRGTQVKMIPKSIGNLQNLETLDLKGTHVTKLPAEICKLRLLRHLLVYRYKVELYASFPSLYGFEALANIGDLSSLQKLCFIEATCTTVGELGKLTQLRRLCILELKREDGMALCSSIEKLSDLRSLSVTSAKQEEIIDLHSLSSAPPFLQHLYLTGCLEKLPVWITSLHNLLRLSLRWSQLRDDPLQSLQHLPNLVYLTLLQAYNAEAMCFEAGGFPKLKFLYLVRLKELRCVRMEKGVMPNLEKLYIRNCKLLEGVPSGIEHLTNLKLFELGDMPTHDHSNMAYSINVPCPDQLTPLFSGVSCDASLLQLGLQSKGLTKVKDS
ncbi:hypothetical protein F0562_031966 [Nyssa sinensis]|uniref:AAA+ ATPase domain-containing protein n=1 Tax=Nyssa sinensis TaxID=561372 RepID=A0A5J5AVF4_9ASTE|nr:hypothetical protein F0562_031966 [Nyssa sinensis]